MTQYQLLQALAAAGRPVRIARIGAGKFGSMFLAQARLTPGFHVAVVADLNVEKALQALTTTGWAKEQFAARGLADALKSGATWVTDDAGAIFKAEAIEVVIDATGTPPPPPPPPPPSPRPPPHPPPPPPRPHTPRPPPPPPHR